MMNENKYYIFVVNRCQAYELLGGPSGVGYTIYIEVL